jgi:hypothetical protein
MRIPSVVTTGLSLLFTVGCGGSTLIPTSPSASVSTQAPAPSASSPTVEQSPSEEVITGSVAPLRSGATPCYVQRYSCEVYGFTMRNDGAVEVTLTWEGGERALLIQLYEKGSRLVHEDLARRGAPPRISFRRTDLDARDYELRVVNYDGVNTIPFTLTLKLWD